MSKLEPLLGQPGLAQGSGMAVKRLPPDDLPVAKPERSAALGLVSNLARLDPAHLDSAEPDDDVPVCDEAIRDDPRPHALVSRLEPIPRFSVAVQSRAARGLQLNLGVEQGEELGSVVALIEELGPS